MTWALVITLFELLTCNLPFGAENGPQVTNRILRGCLTRLEGFDPCIERQSIMDMCTFVLERSY